MTEIDVKNATSILRDANPHERTTAPFDPVTRCQGHSASRGMWTWMARSRPSLGTWNQRRAQVILWLNNGYYWLNNG